MSDKFKGYIFIVRYICSALEAEYGFRMTRITTTP